jgi:hypothetical protein
MLSKSSIIQSHRLFENILDKQIINALVYLFNKNNKTDNNIAKYVDEERKNNKLNTMNVTYLYEVYGENTDNSTLYLGIIKNRIDFIHLTIHLSIKTLENHSVGMIHISKDIYPKGKYKNRNTGKKMQKPKPPYAPIFVESPSPHSLKFSIPEQYYTTPEINAPIYDTEIKEEMDAIITVLNRLFDEHNKQYYIGNRMNNGFDPEKTYLPFNKNKINSVLANMNRHTNIIGRKNQGQFMYPPFVNNEVIHIRPQGKTLKVQRINNRRKHTLKAHKLIL